MQTQHSNSRSQYLMFKGAHDIFNVYCGAENKWKLKVASLRSKYSLFEDEVL